MTYQDMIHDLERGVRIEDEVEKIIDDYQSSGIFQQAWIAEDYYTGNNTTITNYQRMITDAYGKMVPDRWSPNHKIACHDYRKLVIQEALFLLGNGVSFNGDTTKEKLGEDFDIQAVKALIDALNGSVSFAFVNKDHIEVYSVREFAPLYDEETGALRAGVRWWQLDADKPLRATLFEEDGYTEFKREESSKMKVMSPKRTYLQKVERSEATGERVIEESNYPTLPVVPLYNTGKRSELEGNREIFDGIDLLTSGFVNNVDAGEVIYWLLKSAGGMNQESLNKVITSLKATHVLAVDDDEEVTPHSPDVKFQASEAAIERLRQQAYDNMMGLDVRKIAGGAATATQIRAAYEPLNSKTDLVELQVTQWILGLLKVLGIEDKPSYTRSYIINQNEEVQTLVAASTILPQEYVMKKVLELVGDIDRFEEVRQMMIEEGAALVEPVE